MSPGNKNLLDKFQHHLWCDYKAYCHRQGLPVDLQDFITFIIDKGHVSEKHIKRFTILREFDPVYEKMSGHKTNTVETLADRFCLSERTVWNILKCKSQAVGKQDQSS